MSYSSVSIPKPKDWQDFERKSAVLFECLLNDFDVQRNGRSGQKQLGVDIFGRQNGIGGWIGVQCKGKDADWMDRKTHIVTEEELRSEIEKAERFNPPLSKFILATTAPNDVKIQEIARTITAEREKQGKFPVSVWGWDTLQEKISPCGKALKEFYPDATPFTDQMLDSISSVSETNTQLHSKTHAALSETQARLQAISESDNAVREVKDQAHHSEIDISRDLLRSGKSESALSCLQKTKDKIWNTASDRVKFRILTNIGSALLSLDRDQEAASHFVEAYQYQPEDKVAQSNFVLSKLLNDETESAKKTALDLLENNPTNFEVAALLIQILAKDINITDPLLSLPEEVKNSAPVSEALIYFLRERKDSSWKILARDFAKKFPDSKNLKRSEAEADLDDCLAGVVFLLGERTSNSVSQEKIKEVAEVLQVIWDEDFNSERAIRDTALPQNLIQAYRVLGDNQSALRVAQQAIQKKDSSRELKRQCSELLYEAGKHAESLALLEQISDDHDALLGICAIKMNTSPEEVQLLLESKNISSWELEQKEKFIMLLTDSLVRKKNPDKEKALKVAKDFIEENRTIYSLAILASIYKEMGNIEEAKIVLNEAKLLVSSDTPFFNIYFLAKAYEAVKCFKEIADLLRERVDSQRETDALALLFVALVNSDDRKAAKKLLDTLPMSIARSPLFLRVAIGLHSKRGVYTAAEKAALEYLNQKPNDLAVFLDLVVVYMRMNNVVKIRELLSPNLEHLEGSLEDKIRLIWILEKYKFYQKSLELAYELQVRNKDNPEVGFAYLGLFFLAPSGRITELKREKVDVDTAVILENKDKETQLFIIETDVELRKYHHNSIDTDNPIFKAAFNKNVGEKIILGTREWVIKSIDHKCSFIFKEVLKVFDSKFPGFSGFKSFRVDEGEDAIKACKDQVKARVDFIKNALVMYRDNFLPLEFLKNHTGSDIIDLWSELKQDGFNFRSCIGNDSERKLAYYSIRDNEKAGCVVDALTMHLIYLLEIDDIISAVCGQMVTTESMIDVFRNRREKTRDQKPGLMIGCKDEDFIRFEITEDDIKKAVDFIEKELGWIAENVAVIAAEADHKFSDDLIKMSELISQPFLDPMFVSKDTDKLLLCEDLAYRQLAAREGIAKTSWLQPVLMQARDQKIITLDRYHGVLCKLIEFGHNFITIESSTLSYAFFHDDWKYCLKSVSLSLFNQDADPVSHFSVVMAFLAKVWDSDEDQLKIKAATSIILSRIFFGDWRKKQGIDETEEVSLKVLMNFGKKFPEFNDYLISWRIGHFLD